MKKNIPDKIKNTRTSKKEIQDVYKQLQNDLAQCHNEKEEYLTGWQRCQADAINVRLQEDIKRKNLSQFAAEDFIIELIPVLDTFYYAFHNKDADDPYVIGFRHIYNQLLHILNQRGLTIIEAKDKEFNTVFHEATDAIEVIDKKDNNKIITVVENGYMLNGKVVKPAKVHVGEYNT
jgi:molecular chaperone GrpE